MSDAPLPPADPAPPRLTEAQLVPDTGQSFVHCTLDTAGARRLLELTDARPC